MKNRNLILALIVFGNLIAISTPLTARPNVKKYEAQELQRQEQLRRQREAYERAELQKMEKSRAEQSAQREKIAKYASRAGRFIENSLTFCNGELFVARGNSILYARHLDKALTPDMLYPVYNFRRNDVDVSKMFNDGITEQYILTFYMRVYDHQNIYARQIGANTSDIKDWSKFFHHFSTIGVFAQLLNKGPYNDLLLMTVSVDFYKNGIIYADTDFQDMKFGRNNFSLLNELNSDKSLVSNSILPCGPESELMQLAPKSEGPPLARPEIRADSAELDPEPELDSSSKNLSRLEALLGKMYFNGEGVPQDNYKAEVWFGKAAKHGDDDAKFQLGKSYYKGEGIRQDFIKAAEWLRKPADQGHSKAQALLGVMYFEGEGVPKNNIFAAQWLRKPADEGYAEAQTLLGVIYAEGEGVPKNLSMAAEWLNKAADQGYAGAQTLLGVMYAEGEGVPKNMSMAAEWLRKAADQGYDDANMALKELGLLNLHTSP